MHPKINIGALSGVMPTACEVPFESTAGRVLSVKESRGKRLTYFQPEPGILCATSLQVLVASKVQDLHQVRTNNCDWTFASMCEPEVYCGVSSQQFVRVLEEFDSTLESPTRAASTKPGCPAREMLGDDDGLTVEERARMREIIPCGTEKRSCNTIKLRTIISIRTRGSITLCAGNTGEAMYDSEHVVGIHPVEEPKPLNSHLCDTFAEVDLERKEPRCSGAGRRVERNFLRSLSKDPFLVQLPLVVGPIANWHDFDGAEFKVFSNLHAELLMEVHIAADTGGKGQRT
ncbi:hypothetical protein C8R44DRAFT_930986 [Mycena epipterygia]|nr:hypothetical protein C8R44DRAFT_930986 [Mycena epipterygia]